MSGINEHEKAHEGKAHGEEHGPVHFLRRKEMGQEHGEKGVGAKEHAGHVGVEEGNGQGVEGHGHDDAQKARKGEVEVVFFHQFVCKR